jgi:ATP-dependent 26S proteasome regulatory subunit
MKNKRAKSWTEANQRYLIAALAEVRLYLERHGNSGQNDRNDDEREKDIKQELTDASAAMPSIPALESLCALLHLSSFERLLLLLCAGIEFDSSFAALYASVQNDPRRTYPTFSLALAILPGAHWSALTPAAPLRYWRLIEIGAGESLTTSILKIDENIVHYLAGISQTDERLMGIVEPLSHVYGLVPSHNQHMELIVQAWSKSDYPETMIPIINLCGRDISDRQNIASVACDKLGLQLRMIRAGSLPDSPAEIETLIRLWEREALLRASAVLLECNDIDFSETTKPGFIKFVEQINGAVFVSARERNSRIQRPALTVNIANPLKNEQRELLTNTLRNVNLPVESEIDSLLSQFDMSARLIQDVSSALLTNVQSAEQVSLKLWDTCRMHVRNRLENLALRIEPAAVWDDLVLSQEQIRVLREISLHMRERTRVYDEWGFAAKSHRGLGISALFEGTSGTGKTMAAEVLANELRLDLYRIDLSAVVSKYIGETEKNLRAIFDAAETAGAILLFDEADALFGKRSEVRDSHDRYANIEVSYLLQRMESYRGLAILTTNMKNALDGAFMRRIRFVVQFPFPDATYRTEIWKRIFPLNLPKENIDFNKLSKLTVAGGNIRNIALNAAFIAANDGGYVTMKHLLSAARSEYTKLEKPLSAAEVQGWI